MKLFLKYNWPYFLLYLLVLIVAGNILLSMDKVQIHNHFNALVGNTVIDTFFKYITHLGDGIFAVLVAILFLFSSIKKSVYILMSYLISGGISSIMKHQIYGGSNRPHFVYQYYVHKPLKLIDGVDILAENTFPSGHALSAFVLFFCLLFITKNHWYKFLFFVIACLAAYSRVHISQHWLVDIYFGSIIGVLFSVLFYFIFYANAKFQHLDISLSTYLAQKKKRV